MNPFHPWQRWTELGASVVAGAMMAMAALATWLGLDQNLEWGPRRSGNGPYPERFWRDGIPSSGALWPLIRATHVDNLARELRALGARGLALARASPVGMPMSQASGWIQARQARISTLLMGMVVLAVSAWFISVGYWTRWPRSSAYYDLQAEAFVHGQVHLLEEPTRTVVENGNSNAH